MKKNILLSTCLALMLCACNSAVNKLDIAKNNIHINGNLLFNGGLNSLDCLVGRPNGIIVSNSLLIFSDYYDGKLITVFDINNNKCVGRFVIAGQGPNDALPPLFILRFPQKDMLYAFQDNTRHLYSFDIPGMDVQNKILFHEWPGVGSLGVLKDYYVAIGNWQDGRFGIFDRERNVLRTEGKYPFQGDGMDDPVKRYLKYQGHIISNPNGNYFAIGCGFSDNLEFYEVKENETLLHKKYESYDAKVQFPAGYRVQIEDDCIVSYEGGFGTDKYCYMLYSGKKFGERVSGGYNIIIFDWKGNYIKTLTSSVRIRSFCVDENDSQIYAIVLTDDGEVEVMQFNI